MTTSIQRFVDELRTTIDAAADAHAEDSEESDAVALAKVEAAIRLFLRDLNALRQGGIGLSDAAAPGNARPADRR